MARTKQTSRRQNSDQKVSKDQKLPNWAYDVGNFDPAPGEELICSVCHDVFNEPVLSDCQHVFCRGCLMKWRIHNSTCPICRQPFRGWFGRPAPPIYQSLIEKLRLRCPVCQGDPMSIEEAENHICPEEDRIRTRISRAVFLDQESCSNRTEQCPRCELQITTQPAEAAAPAQPPRNPQHDCLKALRKKLEEQKQDMKWLKLRILRHLEEEEESNDDESESDEMPSWAYNVGNFDPAPDEELVCSVCRDVFNEPVLSNCQHVFSRGCLQQWMSLSPTCPICYRIIRARTVRSAPPIYKSSIEKLRLRCPACQGDPMSMTDAVKHRCPEILDHERRTCPTEQCRRCKLQTTTQPSEAAASSPQPSSRRPKHDCLKALRKKLKEQKQDMKLLKCRMDNVSHPVIMNHMEIA